MTLIELKAVPSRESMMVNKDPAINAYHVVSSSTARLIHSK